MTDRARIVVTGADGFIGRNLCVRLAELGRADVVPVTRGNAGGLGPDALAGAGLVFHLAAANRPEHASGFVRDNVVFTRTICDLGARAKRPPPIVFTSSVHAAQDSPYGASKRAAEDIVTAYARATGTRVHILRLTNVFGKWARPNHNSVVATVCHNAARGLPPPAGDPAVPLRLVYIDDLVDTLVGLIAPDGNGDPGAGPLEVRPVYQTTLGAVTALVQAFAAGRRLQAMPPAGHGLARALYATYVSHLDPAGFAYDVPVHADPRGAFVELLKTEDGGQVSYFTVRPGVTRGSHYHHTKTEKFVVVHGTARFRFRAVGADEVFESRVQSGEGRIVDIPPGWAHDVTNVGDDELVCIVWANEAFDRDRPDTVAARVTP